MLTSVKIDPYGVVKDTNPHDVGDEWTDVLNMRFMDNSAQKFRGETRFIDTTGQALHLLFNGSHDVPKWYYMGDGNINVYDGSSDTLLTGVISTDGRWDASLFNQIPIFNNGVDQPWVTLDDLAAIPLTGFLVDSCQAIRPYKSFLIAMNIQAGADDDGNRLIWSDSSDAGALPSSWDIADPSTLAGDAYLSSERGEILDGLQLRDHFALYKTHATYLMTLVAGQSVMRIQKIQTESGILAKNCVAEFEGKHFIVADGDIVLFDGQNIKSIANKRVRNTIFGSIDTTYFYNTYVARYSLTNEMWVCYPENGKQYPSKAAVWNWEDNTWTFRSLGVAPHIASGVVSFAPHVKWDAAAGVWDDYKGFWQPLSSNPTIDQMVKAGASDSAEISPDIGFDNNSVWSFTNGADVAGGQCTIPSTGSAYADSSVTMVSGQQYEIDIDFESITGDIRITLGGLVADSVSASGTYTITAINTGVQLGVSSLPGNSAVVNSFSVKALSTGLFIIDETNDFDSQAMSSSLEKQSMDLGDMHRVKLVNKVVPQITAPNGTKVYIRLGVQMRPDESISWLQEVLFTVGEDDHVSVIGKGRYISIKLRTEDLNTSWKCHGVQMYYRGAGNE